MKGVMSGSIAASPLSHHHGPGGICRPLSVSSGPREKRQSGSPHSTAMRWVIKSFVPDSHRACHRRVPLRVPSLTLLAVPSCPDQAACPTGVLVQHPSSEGSSSGPNGECTASRGGTFHEWSASVADPLAHAPVMPGLPFCSPEPRACPEPGTHSMQVWVSRALGTLTQKKNFSSAPQGSTKDTASGSTTSQRTTVTTTTARSASSVSARALPPGAAGREGRQALEGGGEPMRARGRSLVLPSAPPSSGCWLQRMACG